MPFIYIAIGIVLTLGVEALLFYIGARKMNSRGEEE
ncbi:hypothetical protein SAMN05192556_11325 [Halomonas caseinilytica]|uniref:Uncharacterized protein n=1 Tax=Halomonas caseinilytica TaxID=438744 RepID=A0A1M7ADE7_9GAMM|nr:hypothetical protein SAMN05192556_11325 [Halomonas caseinilytica]